MCICKFCGKEQKLTKAHIIPEKFYIYLNEGPYKILSSNNYSVRSQSGVYDKNILCRNCDLDIGVYDNEAITLLLNNINNYEVSDISMREQRERLFIISKENFNYKILRKFFVSLIWRASISKATSFSKVSLGIYEEIALKILKDEITDNVNLFAPIIFKTDSMLSLSKAVLAKAIKQAISNISFFIIPS